MSVTVQISEETAEIIQRKVEQGLYADTETALAEAARLLDELDLDPNLVAQIQIGIDQAERGDVYPWNDETKQRIIREGSAKYERGDPIKRDVRP